MGYFILWTLLFVYSHTIMKRSYARILTVVQMSGMTSIIPSEVRDRHKTTAEMNRKLYINLFYKVTMYL